jgi:16S rRNA (cytosine967-C5)-methyltransferase
MIKFAKRLQHKWRNQKTGSESAFLRAQAAIAIGQVIDDGSSLRVVFKQRNKQFDNPKHLGLFKEICFGTIRFYSRLEAITNYCLHKPLEKKNFDIKYLICTGLYQLTEMNTASYAVVNETVEAVRLLNKPWACKLVNKILRQFLRQQKKIITEIKKNEAAWLAYPQWLLERVKEDWPENWQDIIEESNKKPPLSLRINQQKTSSQGYHELLKKESIEAELCPDYQHAIIIKKPMPTKELPGFEHGLFSVQDLAGQQVARLLNLKPEQNILDACAAPGSKTCHILETEPAIHKIVAIDIDAERLLRVKENLIRLSLPQERLKMVLEDASHTKQWWDGVKFDKILLDAPCSATGVIRRHPDIKILRQSTDIEKQSQVQLQLLKTLWPLLKEDGQLLYTTCSLLKQENEKVIHQFLKDNKKASHVKIEVPQALPLKYGCQLLPTTNGSDGFYFALLQHKS